MALERRRQLVDDALPHPSDDFRTRLRHEGREQEARKRPGQAKAARREGRRRQVERAVDIDLLERVRAIAAVGRHPLDRRGFHRGQYLPRSEEHTSELQSLMRISYAVFCLQKTTNNTVTTQNLY